MKSFLTSVILLSSLSVSADTNLLLQGKGAELDFSRQLKFQQQLEFNDAFQIQFYSRWKALGAVDSSVNDWMMKVFSKDYSAALKDLNTLNDPKLIGLKKPGELYLLFRLGYFQTFISEWIDYTASTGFLKTELGLALDQVVAPQSSQLLITSGVSLTPEMLEKLSQAENYLDSRFNISLQAFKALKTGENAVQWIGRLAPDDQLRVHLAQTALLAYGKKGMLGASGKFIKKVVEPWMEQSENSEEIGLYYMTLARLLYQAKAYDAAEEYYQRIPESSRYFLQARTEFLWTLLQKRDFSRAMGELATLKLGVFEDRFYPEVYLVSSIAHTMMCQFVDAKNSIAQFVRVNKNWAKIIEENIESKNPPMIEEDFFTKVLRRQVATAKKERARLKERELGHYDEALAQMERHAMVSLRGLAKQQWVNRRVVLESALYKLKFVRVELLSRMRAVAEGLREQLPTQDTVSSYQSAAVSLSNNQMTFPNDGMLWGDELFHMNADVKNQCLKGEFYEK